MPKPDEVQITGVRGLTILLWIVLLVSILSVVFGIIPLQREKKSEKGQLEERLELASRLRSQGLPEQALEEFESALQNPTTPKQKKGNIARLMGDIYFEDQKNHEMALASYIKSKYYGADGSALQHITGRIVECQERMGRSLDAERTLTQATYLAGEKPKAAEKGTVVARIGDREITAAELDSQIQKFPPQAQQVYSVPEQKLEFLKMYLGQELLYDAAQRKGLQKAPEMLRQFEDMRKALLARKVLEEELKGKVAVTDRETTLYYEARKDDYKDWRRVRIAQMAVGNETHANELYGKLKASPEKFDEVAASASAEKKDGFESGELGWVTEGNNNIPTLGQSQEATSAVLSLEQGQITAPIRVKDKYRIFAAREVKPERQRPYSEVKAQIEQQLRAEKEQEAREAYISDLMKVQKVTIFEGALGVSSSDESTTKTR